MIPASTSYTEFGDYLETIVSCEEQLVVVGDFNIYVDLSNDCNSMKLLDLLESFSLRQHVVSPTQVCGHTLDLIITRQSDQIIRFTPKVDRYISDHASVLCQLRSSKPPLTIRTVSYRKCESVDVVSLNADLANLNLCKNPPGELDQLVYS